MNKEALPFNEDEALQKFILFASSRLNKEKPIQNRGAFELTKNNEQPLRQLLMYFAGVPGELDLVKGVCLQGPTGSGKTTIMRYISMWLGNGRPQSFRMANCRDIQKEAAAGGYEALYKYTRQSYNFNNGFHRENGPVTYCFDDLGAENNSKFYGTEINVMEELLQDRYNEAQITGMLTHATTNIKDGKVYEQLYGLRVRDRMREMFNFVELNGPSFRR